MSLGNIVDTVIQAYRKCLFAELEKMPIVYDVDKVVKQMEEYIKESFNVDYSRAMIEAIEIVKSGGIG